MATYVGTSGWSYKEWRGSFYPKALPADEMLGYYAERFSAVEVNHTFYRMPSEGILAGWSQQVPPAFRFVTKASRRITHTQRLRDEDGSLSYFLRTVNVLGPQLGPTLFQLPPNFKADVGALAAFFEMLPRRWPTAFEFRHSSWFVEEVYDLLRKREVPLVAVDAEEGGAPLVRTAAWGYVRLRRTNYSAADLTLWADRIRSQGWCDAYIFLKHEEGSPVGPAAARDLKSIFESAEKRDQDHHHSGGSALP